MNTFPEKGLMGPWVHVRDGLRLEGSADSSLAEPFSRTDDAQNEVPSASSGCQLGCQTEPIGGITAGQNGCDLMRVRHAEGVRHG